jgi:hypothetical protein
MSKILMSFIHCNDHAVFVIDGHDDCDRVRIIEL